MANIIQPIFIAMTGVSEIENEWVDILVAAERIPAELCCRRVTPRDLGVTFVLLSRTDAGLVTT